MTVYIYIYIIYKQRSFLQIYCVVQGTFQAVFISVPFEIIKIVTFLVLFFNVSPCIFSIH